MNLDTSLAQLETAQLVLRAQGAEPAFQFNHALTQDAAYGLLLLKQRRELHRQVAQSYEELYAEQLDRLAAPLAQHYTEAGDDAKALAYFKRAGDAAARVYANAEALQHYTHALELARRCEPIDAQEIEYLYRRRGREMELASQFKTALASYEEMEHFSRERANRPLELSAMIARCQILCTANSEFNPEQGEPLAQRALILSRELKDRAAESKILWILVNLYRFTGRVPQAREAGELSLKIARELNLREQMAYTLNDLSHVYSFEGNFKHARTLIEEAMQLWRELKNLPMLADSLATASMDDNIIGRFDETIAFSDEAFQISQSIGNSWGQTYSLSNLGLAYWMHGETARAVNAMEETLRLSDQSGYPVPKFLTRAELGMAYASVGAFRRAVEHARGAVEFADAFYPSMRPYILGALIQIYLWMGDHAQAAEALTLFRRGDTSSSLYVNFEALSTARLASAQADHAQALAASTRLLQLVNEFGIRSYLPEALFCKGEAERGLGQTDSARASLSQARLEAQAIGSRWQLWQILGALGGLESACGNQSQATQLFGEAREVIAYIADHAPAELRDSFLNLSHVRRVQEYHVEK